MNEFNFKLKFPATSTVDKLELELCFELARDSAKPSSEVRQMHGIHTDGRPGAAQAPPGAGGARGLEMGNSPPCWLF